ncbi:MAG: TSUP family transporter [Candidatus Competibacteraceae bacterium]|nr:TSUP family transporter [Candidatus Competibacteraceae bacterium]
MTVVLTTMLAILVMVLGSVLQAASGLGAGLVVVPLLSLIALDWVPGPCVAASLLLSGLMAYRGRKHWHHQHLAPMLLGLLLGIALGGVLVALLPLAILGLLFGILILGAVGLSAAGLQVSFTTAAAGLAGVLAGFMGTTAGIGAPVLALFYQRLEGPALRGTLGLLYFVSSLAMLAALHLAGRFGRSEVILALQLLPGVLAGYWLSPYLAHWLDRGHTRHAVLVLSIASALALIAKSAGGLL